MPGLVVEETNGGPRTADEDPPLPLGNTVLESIRIWRTAMHEAADRKRDAELAEARGLIAADGRSDAVRKAQATLASAELQRRFERAQADALAAGAIVDVFVGRRER